MSEHGVLHSTFTLQRTYPASPGRVFAAWADPEAKARWFGEHLDRLRGELEAPIGADR